MLPCHPCDYIFTVIYGLTQSKDCWRCTKILSSGQICLSHWGYLIDIESLVSDWIFESLVSDWLVCGYFGIDIET